MIIKIPKEQLQKNINLEKGWYPAIFRKIWTEKNKNNPNLANYWIACEILKDNRLIEQYMVRSDDMRGLQSLFESLSKTKVRVIEKVVQENLELDPEQCYGTEIQVFIDQEPFNGRLIDKMKDFLPKGVSTEVPFGG